MIFLRKKLFILTGVLLCFCIINTSLASAGWDLHSHKWDLRYSHEGSDYVCYELWCDGNSVDFLYVQGSSRYKDLYFQNRTNVTGNYHFPSQMFTLIYDGKVRRNEACSLPEAIDDIAYNYTIYHYYCQP